MGATAGMHMATQQTQHTEKNKKKAQSSLIQDDAITPDQHPMIRDTQSAQTLPQLSQRPTPPSLCPSHLRS